MKFPHPGQAAADSVDSLGMLGEDAGSPVTSRDLLQARRRSRQVAAVRPSKCPVI